MYFVVQSWMISRLSLKGNELLIYAVIYNYSQEGQGCYYGSMSFLAESLGITRQTAINALKTLAERGLIERREEIRGTAHILSYEAKTPENLVPYEILTGCKKTLQVDVKNFDRGCINPLHNNKEDNKINITISPESPRVELPYSSDEFVNTWVMLIRQPKWRSKSRDALAKSAKMLGQYPEDIAVAMMDASIRNGWQGLFPLKAGDIQGKVSSAQSRARDARVAAEERLAASLAAEQQALTEGRAAL